jgi:hypothetical protein
LIFAEPPTSTYEEALSYLLEGEKLKPGFWKKNRLLIAKCYKNLGNQELTKIWIEKTLDLPIRNIDDIEAQNEAKKMQ